MISAVGRCPTLSRASCRQTVEHRLARLVQLGIRQARYVGRAKTLFQLAMTAAVANLTLVAASAITRLAPAATLAALARLLTGLVSARRASATPPPAQRSLRRCRRWWGHAPPVLALGVLTSRDLAAFRLDF